jgi:hypothetical protein
MEPIKKQARVAGLLYTIVAVTGPLSLVYIPHKLLTAGQAWGTADRVHSSESLLRLGIASELLYQTLEIFLVLTLYGLFKTVNNSRARQMATLGLIPIPIVLAVVLDEIAALTLASGAKFLSGFDKPQLDALATLFLGLHAQGLQVAALFWGLWLFPLGSLVIRCGFIPKVLGVSAMIAGVGYLIGSTSSLVIPQYASSLGSIAGVLEIGELPIILWLLIWGARARPSNSKLATAV